MKMRTQIERADVGVPQNQAAVRSGMADVNGAKRYYEITGGDTPSSWSTGAPKFRREDC
jgi:hypothetical protein